MIDEDMKKEDEVIKLHELTDEQQERLNRVKAKFPSYEKNDLGCTLLQRHSIKLLEGTNSIRGKHYPISPAGINIQ